MDPLKYANVETPIDVVQPAGEFVLVEVLGENQYLDAGLVKPPGPAYDRDRPGIRKGRVVTVGPRARLAGNVAAGDVVLYTRVPANGIELNGREYVFVREHQHVYAVVEGEVQ